MSSETVGVKVAGFIPVNNCLISYVDGESRKRAPLVGRACCMVYFNLAGLMIINPGL